MPAVRIVDVAADALGARRQAGAQLIGEDAPAQLLGFEDFRLVLGETDVQGGLGAPFAIAPDADVRSLIHAVLLS